MADYENGLLARILIPHQMTLCRLVNSSTLAALLVTCLSATGLLAISRDVALYVGGAWFVIHNTLLQALAITRGTSGEAFTWSYVFISGPFVLRQIFHYDNMLWDILFTVGVLIIMKFTSALRPDRP